MFNIDRSEETQAVVELGRSLAIEVVDPVASSVDADGVVPAQVMRTLAGTGMLAPISESLGGDGLPSCAAHLQFAEALGHGDPGVAAAALFPGAAAVVLARVPDAQDVLRSLLTTPGELGLALWEGFGRGPSESDLSVVNNTVHAVKRGVCLAGDPSRFLIIGADTAVIVDRSACSETVPRRLALDAARFATVRCDAVPIRSRFAVDSAMRFGIAHARMLGAAIALGGAQRATEYAAAYANERIAFGKPISTFQGVSFMLAEAALKIGAARLELIDMAWQVDAQDSTDLEARTTHAVNYAGQVAVASTRDAIQVLGGHGFITDHPVERWYRAAATLAALDHDPLLSSFEPAL
jgi:alkylation response protein AidB-like acyl-CoA dehydrogenase